MHIYDLIKNFKWKALIIYLIYCVLFILTYDVSIICLAHYVLLCFQEFCILQDEIFQLFPHTCQNKVIYI